MPRVRGVQPRDADLDSAGSTTHYARDARGDIQCQTFTFPTSTRITTPKATADLSRGILQAMYLRPPSENQTGFFAAVAVYDAEIVYMEPRLLKCTTTYS